MTINYHWRVTKYNPNFRDENGYYTLKEEWTCPSEIGKIINGKEFTLDEYLHVESAYVNTVIKFLTENKLSSLRILQLSILEISPEEKSSLLFEPEFTEINLDEDAIVSIDEIRTICKMILRNYLGCQLYSKDNFFVHFGWDYYMFIGSAIKPTSAIQFATENGLFVEEIDSSPYYFTEEQTTRLVQWTKISDEVKVVVADEEIKQVPLEEYRKIFNLSEEHPVIGSFKITIEQKNFFQRFIEHRMDFNKYEYWFWGGF